MYNLFKEKSNDDPGTFLQYTPKSGSIPHFNHTSQKFLFSTEEQPEFVDINRSFISDTLSDYVVHSKNWTTTFNELESRVLLPVMPITVCSSLFSDNVRKIA